ncbi:MAG TPA: autotransporter-associated beta strand repeat-containing protein [Planctomycetota bacterium]|nr:autotransporter-associated beta strand repeat-containing protein [Planctomycetota bacterium]HRR80270.1 autotransporter-associated beta strand repeat-containing protein [Planctomycetota bacterium]
MKRTTSCGWVGCLVAVLSLSASGAPLYWDGDGVGSVGGGSGTWDTTLSRWSTTPGGSAYQVWVNANLDDAVFQNAPGIVTLGAPVTAHDLTFAAQGYRLVGTNALTLGGVTPTVSVAGPSDWAMVDVPIQGAAGLIRSGAGRLFLTEGSTFTGGVTLNSGITTIINSPNLGDPANVVTLNGGTLQLANSSGSAGGLYLQLGNPVTGGARTIVVGPSGGTIDVPAISNGADGAAITGINALTGSGTLTKTGLGYLFVAQASDFSGNLVVAPNGNQFDIRAMGTMLNVASVTIGQSSYLNVDNQNQLMSRQFPGGASNLSYSVIPDRISDTAPILLEGGRLMYVARNTGLSGTSSREVFGATTVGLGQSEIRAERAGGGGSDLILSNLIHNVGGGTVRFTAGNTIGLAGDNGRITLQQVNGVAPTTGMFLGGWAVVNSDNFATYVVPASLGAAGGVVPYGSAVAGAPAYATTPFASGKVVNLTADYTIPAGDSVVGALRLAGAATRQVLFTNPGDTLYVESGGILSDGSNNARNIGATGTRGRLTAGTTSATTPQELFLHNNSNTTTIWSQIINNPNDLINATVALVKDLDGQVNLENDQNSYTGGTYVLRGTLEARAAGTLGYGPVTVKNSRLNLNAAGAINAAATAGGYTIVDNGQILLNSTSNYNTTWDRFTVPAGGVLSGQNSNTANQGLGSLTRVASLTGGGQVVLAPGAVVAHNSHFNDAANGTGVRTVQNLGTNADLFYGLYSDFNPGAAGSLTVGAGTAWTGISTDRSDRRFTQGTIVANSDFTLQGLLRDNGYALLYLGGTGGGTYGITNASGGPINANIVGRVALDENSPVSLPSDLTFVVTPGATLSPNQSNSLGSGGSFANVLVQAGGTLDPGNFTGVPPAIPGPLNGGLVTVAAGGRLLLNDASGVGSGQAGNITMQSDSILHLNSNNVFLGAATGQFVYEPGAIVRIEYSSPYGLKPIVSDAPGGSQVVYEVWNGDRTLTNQIHPLITAGPGSPNVAPEVLTIANGGMLTNDSNDRRLNEGRGRVILGDGAVLAGTSQTYFNIQESLDVQAGATVYIGSSRWVDGDPKLGAVQFVQAGTNTAGAGVTFNVVDGAQLSFNQGNVFPDTARLHLPAAVTYWPPVGNPPPGAWSGQPGNGSTLLLNTGWTEVIGELTGNGAVMGNTGAMLAAGWGTASNFTFDGLFKSANSQNPGLVKVGSTRMTLTNTSDSTGSLTVYQGELALAGPNGRWRGGEMRLSKGGTLLFDNSGTAVADRQVAGGTWLTTLAGGDFRVLGHATQAADVAMYGLGNSAGSAVTGISGGNTGGFGTVTVIPDGDLSMLRTSVTFGQMENFQSSSDRNSVWLLRGAGIAGLPGTHDANGVYTPNAGNPQDGLIFITNPNLLSSLSYGQQGGVEGFGPGTPGTPLVPVRGDLLAAVDPNATEGDFATMDVASGAKRTGVRILQASEYASTTLENANLSLNLRLTGALNFAGGDTRLSVLKMENGSSLSVSGVVPLLTQPAQVVVNAGGILVPSGATASLTASGNGAGADSVIRTGGGVSAYLHTFGDLSVDGEFFTDQRLVKTGSGTASFTAGSLSNLRGGIALHEGTLSINDSLANIRETGINASSFYGIHLELNGGTLDLNGNSQFFRRLESGNILPGVGTEGGTLTSAAPARVTVQDGGTFSGHITGDIAFHKVGNNTLYFTNSNPYTGETIVRQGTLLLRDSGTLPNTPQIDLNYARLDIVNDNLSGMNDRVNPAAVINMRGGDFVNRGRPGMLTQEHLGTVNVLQGQNLFQTLAGGSGATETHINNLVRSAGATVAFQQNYGFVGTAGNDTTAIRYLINQINSAPVALNDGLIGGWAIVNNDHFATYLPATGVSYMSNTSDGYANYDSSDLSAATATQNVNDGTSRTIAASKTVNSIRFSGGATHTLNAGVLLTVDTGGIMSNTNAGHGFTGAGQITSNSGELNLFVNQNTMTIGAQITGNIALTKAGGATLRLQGNNNYTGNTYFQALSGASDLSGLVELNTASANGSTIVAIPGNLHIHNTTVTELLPNQIKNTATVYLYGGGTLNLRDAGGVTETLDALVFSDAGSNANARPIVSRANAQATSALNLTGATPITVFNDNPTSTPTISTNVGSLAFTRGAGNAQTLLVNSPVTVNGLAAAGLLLNANITTVPTGVDDGGLIKAGNGLLLLGGSGSTFGNPGAPTEVFNIQEGYVRVDHQNALGPVNAITTVQNGATLLLNNNSGITGSLQLKNGSTLSVTLNSSTLGTVGSTGTVDVPAGANVDVLLRDYFIPATNNGNIVNNHRLTGAGTLHLAGIEYAAGYNGGGILQLQNTANDFAGTINIGTNAILTANSSSGTGNTLGTAALALNGGVLRLQDNGTASNQTISYGNNVTLNANSLIVADRQSGSNTTNTIALGTLNVASGAHVLGSNFTGDDFWAVNNSYQVSFAQVDGLGTLVKGGHQVLNINGYAAGFSGNIEIAGPQGIAVQPSGNLYLTAATNNLNNLTVNGIFGPRPSTALNVAGVLEVGDNAGQVVNGTYGVATGSVTGAMSVPSTATVTAATLLNNGIIGSTGGNATLTATQIQGSGLYQTYNQPLTLAGTLADGSNPTVLKVAGNNIVNLVPAASGTSSGGTQVQSGTLRIAAAAPITDPLGTGDIQVLGYAPPVVTAATSATLLFDSGANAIVQNSNIVNSGLVHVASGTVTIGGTLSGPGPGAYVPGLLEGNGGTWNSASPINTGTFGIKLEPRMGNMSVVTHDRITGWSDNETWVYSGQFYDADGYFSFIENIDDNAAVLIDGVKRLEESGSEISSTSMIAGQRGATVYASQNSYGGNLYFGMGPNGDGWHDIEIRFQQGGGGAGPWGVTNGMNNNFGFGLSTDGTRALDGALYTRPIDPGDASLFRTPVAAQGNLQIASGAALNLTAPGATHSTGSLLASGSSGAAALNLANGATLNTGNVTIPSGVTLNASALSGTAALNLTGSLTGRGATLNLANVALTFDSNAAQVADATISGTGSLTKLGTGTLRVGATNNSYSGPTFINQGTVAAAGTGLGTGTVTVALGATLTLQDLSAGLPGEYYNINPGSSGSNPNFATLAALNAHLSTYTPNLISYSTAAGANFDFATNGSLFPAPYNSGGANFEVRWTGKFNAPVAGNYAFWTGSDDGSMLWIDGQEPAAVDNNFFQGVTWRGGTAIPLTAGLHDITIAFYQGTGGYGLQADVQGPAGSGLETRQRLPNSYLLSGVFGNLTIGALAGDGTVALGPYTLTAGGNNADTLFTGQITGTGALVKTGSGALYLTGANSYAGGTTLAGGTLGINGDAALGAVPAAPTTNLTFAGDSTLRTTAALALNANRHILINSGVTATFDTNGFDVAIGGAVAGQGGLTKTGLGSLSLLGAHTYTGPTTVQQGELLTGGTLAGPLSVLANGLLSAGPGVSTNTLLVLDDYDQQGTLRVELAGPNQGATTSGFDFIFVNGLATLAGNATVEIDLLNGFVPPAFSTYDLLVAVDGITADVNLLIVDASSVTFNYGWSLSLVDVPSYGPDAMALRLTAVPEPTTLALLALGGLGLLARARRRRAA